MLEITKGISTEASDQLQTNEDHHYYKEFRTLATISERAGCTLADESMIKDINLRKY